MAKQPAHLLVIRFSALGDVAMAVPVLLNLLQQYPQLTISFAGDPFMQPLFSGIERLKFISADTKMQYRGLPGLYRLSRVLSGYGPFDAIADLHDVLRTKVLRTFLQGPKAAIDKGRKEKRELTRPANKKLRQLKTSFQRYADVFAKLGYPVRLDTNAGVKPGRPKQLSAKKLIGIAPFARHAPKMYPLEQMRRVVEMLAKEDVEVLLFGSRTEAPVLNSWQLINSNIKVVAGTGSFDVELRIISTLDLMISMDSANMHLASLFGVPVLSVWGGTHPFLGFYGWGQDPANAIQLPLDCRPSSVFGNKPCPVHGEQGCMQGITPEDIYTRAMEIIKT